MLKILSYGKFRNFEKLAVHSIEVALSVSHGLVKVILFLDIVEVFHMKLRFFAM